MLFLYVTAFTQTNEAEAVKTVLRNYHDAIQKLDATGTELLFTADSKICESVGVEGTYVHHLGPDLKVFKSFTFSDYKADVRVDGNYAFATETYNYTIVIAKDNSEINRKGVATSVLKKIDGKWKIMVSHSSSRK